MAGQIVMEGFLDIKIRPWLRQLITRLIAIVPALFVTIYYGEHGTGELLVLSQVVLSLQLSFAVIPLVWFTSKQQSMGQFKNTRLVSTLSWVVTSIIIVLNVYLLKETMF